jgi:hypothetical protein
MRAWPADPLDPTEGAPVGSRWHGKGRTYLELEVLGLDKKDPSRFECKHLATGRMESFSAVAFLINFERIG